MERYFQKVADLEITEEGQSHERLLEAVKKHIKYSVQTGGYFLDLFICTKFCPIVSLCSLRRNIKAHHINCQDISFKAFVLKDVGAEIKIVSSFSLQGNQDFLTNSLQLEIPTVLLLPGQRRL